MFALSLRVISDPNPKRETRRCQSVCFEFFAGYEPFRLTQSKVLQDRALAASRITKHDKPRVFSKQNRQGNCRQWRSHIRVARDLGTDSPELIFNFLRLKTRLSE